MPVDGRRVDLSTDKTIDAGADRRGYRFVAVHAEAGLRIVAGCHSFTLREARRHWTMTRGHDADHAAEIAALLDCIETKARARGWVDPQRYLATAPRSADAPAL